MNLLQYKKIIEIFKYLIVGILNNFFNYIIFNFSNNYLDISLFFSGSLGFLGGAVVSYLLNSKFTFSTKRRSNIQFVFFLIIQVFLLNIYSLLILKISMFLNIHLTWF